MTDLERPLSGRVVLHPGTGVNLRAEIKAEPREGFWGAMYAQRGWQAKWAPEGGVSFARPKFAMVAMCALHAWGEVRLIIDGHIGRICSENCQGSTGPACECSCLGRNHGAKDVWRLRWTLKTGTEIPEPDEIIQLSLSTARAEYVIADPDVLIAFLGEQAWDAHERLLEGAVT